MYVREKQKKKKKTRSLAAHEKGARDMLYMDELRVSIVQSFPSCKVATAWHKDMVVSAYQDSGNKDPEFEHLVFAKHWGLGLAKYRANMHPVLPIRKG